MAYFDDETVGPLRGRKRPQGMPGQAQPPAPPAAYSTTPTQAPQTQVPTSPGFGGQPLQRDPMRTPPVYPTGPSQIAPEPPAFGEPPQERPFRVKPFEPPTQDVTPQMPDRPIPPPPAPAPRDTETAPPPPGSPPPVTVPDVGQGSGWAQPPADGNWEAWFLKNAQSMPPTPQSLEAIEAQLSKHGIKVLRNAEGTAGKIQLPNGQIIDVILAAGLGGKAWQWMTPDQAGPSGGASSAQGMATTTQMPQTLGSLTSNLSAAGLTSFQEQMRKMILDQLAGAAQPVDPNSPEVRLPINEAERRAEQIRRRRQSADAERLTQRGLGDSGAIDTARRQGFEDMSQTISGVTAQIIGEQMQNKRRELVTLLTTAMASGDAESARAVQMQLAAIDAELRRMGLAQQNDQYYAGLGQQRDQFNSSLDLDWAQFQSGLL